MSPVLVTVAIVGCGLIAGTALVVAAGLRDRMARIERRAKETESVLSLRLTRLERREANRDGELAGAVG